jgi:hypothetical protein
MQLFNGLFRNKQQSASFSSAATLETPPVKINGAEYTAVDTKDGFFTLKDVLFFGEVPKGEKNAPEDVKSERMQQMVASALAKYEKEKFAAPSHKGHHKAIAFEDPEFLGFMLPKRVGKTVLDGKEQDAIFGDLKLKASAFERVKKGELPYLSPEVDWETWQFSSMALLDSMPPHFKGPLITVGKIMEDASAKFTVDATTSQGKFMALKEKKEGDPKESGEKEEGGIEERLEHLEASFATIDKSLADVFFKMGMPYKGAQMGDKGYMHKQDSSAPKEDDTKGNTVSEKTKFEDDPAVMAKFAAQDASMKALEAKIAAKDLEDAKKARTAAAFEELKDYPLTQVGKDGIAKFADDADKLKVFVDVLKAQTPKNSPKSVSEFEASAKPATPAINGADPDLAEFQLKRPNDMPAILKYAEYHAAWKTSKASFGASDELKNRKTFIEIMMKIDPTADYIKNHKIEGGK